MSNQNPYIQDIISQPEMLTAMLKNFQPGELSKIKSMLDQGDFDRIVITGMGASLYSGYPASLILSNAGLPVSWVDNAELLHYTPELITSKTLLFISSQSGRSAEVVHLLDSKQIARPKAILGITNDLESPLGKTATVTLAIDTPPEQTVSTRTYLNTLAISQLAAWYLLGKDIKPALDDLYAGAESIREYVSHLGELTQQFVDLVHLPHHLVILGRGPSMAAAMVGALIQGEASKLPAFALNAAEFRHGPMEMTQPALTAMILAGDSTTAALNHKLIAEVIQHGGKGFWISSQKDDKIPTLPMPTGNGIALPLVETLPFQVLTLAIAQLSNVIAGNFLYSGKVTLEE